MSSMSNTALTIVALALGSTVALAGDKHDHHHGHKHGKKRELGAHVHGQGKLNVVIAGNTVGLELEAPGADIVGFEHEAKTKKQKAAVASAEKKLATILDLVTIPAEAACTTAKTEVEIKSEGEHSEFHGRYELTCTEPGKITSLAFPYFKAFDKAEGLEVTVVTDNGQSKHEVSRKKSTISLGGSS